MLYEVITHLCLVAELTKNRCRQPVGGIALVGIGLDHRPLVEQGHVIGFVLAGEVGVHRIVITSYSIHYTKLYDHGIEGDSASCAELFALISALAGVPIDQGIAVTGALNQHGEVLPVGGINEKIEGYFRLCREYGLTGSQGVIIPERNRRNLMLDHEVLDAVHQGQFHIYTATRATDSLELLTGLTAGQANARGSYNFV